MISRIEDMVRHVLHVRNVAGCECLALGTDFDGIGGVLEIDTSAKLPLLRDALHDAGMSESELDRMWKGNAMRMFRAMERPF
jgi:membrane dipeptidase